MNGIERIYSINVDVSTDTLKTGFEQGVVADALRDPLQALLPRITRIATDLPVSIYLFSSDQNAEKRDYFGYALAHALQQQIPTALLVDCGFMDLGLSGIVPQKDALGFLDLLLYGSSLEIITQETVGGVHVVGAGSFPVTKKMPFVLNAFNEASRRLIGHSRCAVFCGPLYGDDGDLHPLVGAVDIPMLISGPSAAGTVDPIEEHIASRLESVRSDTTSLYIVRITSGKAVAPEPEPVAPAPAPEPVRPTAPEPVRPAAAEPVQPTAPEPAQPAAPEQPVVPQQEQQETPGREYEEQQAAAAPPPSPPVPEQPPATDSTRFKPIEIPPSRSHPDTLLDVELESRPYKEKSYTSLLPKIATGVIAVLVVVFVVWWMNLERGEPDDTARNQQTEVAETTPAPVTDDHRTGGQTDRAGETATGGDTEAGEETLPPDSGPAAPDSVVQQPETTVQERTTEQAPGESRAEPAQTGDATQPPGQRIDSRNIIVMSDVQDNFAGSYLIHISSFRESAKARNEIAYLEARGFPVFIVFLDLGPKGTWYRVYAGPLDTRDEARNMKKLLDDTPQVRFTRITRVSG